MNIFPWIMGVLRRPERQPSPCGNDYAHYHWRSQAYGCTTCANQERERERSREENRRMIKQAKYTVAEMAKAMQEGRL